MESVLSVYNYSSKSGMPFSGTTESDFRLEW